MISDCENSSGRPYIKFENGYQYINSERGYVISKQVTSDIDELLYWIFEDITSKIAGEYELEA